MPAKQYFYYFTRSFTRAISESMKTIARYRETCVIVDRKIDSCRCNVVYRTIKARFS